MAQSSRSFWLLLSKLGPVRAADSWDDRTGSEYVWPLNIPHARSICVGDAIAIWDSQELLGVSWIDAIEDGHEARVRMRCSRCKLQQIRERTRRRPRFVCGARACGFETDHPEIELDLVAVRRARYGAGWSEIEEHVGAADCRALTVQPNGQHSIRPIIAERLLALLDSLDRDQLAPFRARDPVLPGGHRSVVVRARVGQREFRRSVLEDFGSNCAFTGPNVPEALDAAHLYRFAEHGIHHVHGGLPLRKDLHRLFDLGHVRVDPERLRLDLSDRMKAVPTYRSLAGQQLQVRVPEPARVWLGLHWEQHHGVRT